MRQSQLFYKTEKVLPDKKETISHELLKKAGFINQLASGLYSLLPLGFLVHKKIENIIREEMKNIGAQEVFLPALQPKEIWEKTKRWNTIDPPLFKLKDRHQKEFALGSTHEEVISDLARLKIKSYRDLPAALFQIQTKFRNELRFSGGLLRAREFVMKDLYSFHRDKEDFEKYYKKAMGAYLKIFKRCGLKAIVTEASGQGFTKSVTHEFQILTPAGEDKIIFCKNCAFSQNQEIARKNEGEKCLNCNKGVLELKRGIEVGNIFPLEDKYSNDFDLYFVDKDNKKKPVIMGCYGIGLGRLMAAAVEINCDKKGIVWPKEIAPYSVHLLAIDLKDKKVFHQAESFYQSLQDAGMGVLYDDRPQASAGEKFFEADLIGIPKRIVISKKTLGENKIELKERKSNNLKMISQKQALRELKL